MADYKEAGVDVEAGYKAVELMKKSVQETYTKGVMSDLGGFGGLFKLDLSEMKEPILVSGTDGVGTKLKLAFLLNKHDNTHVSLSPFFVALFSFCFAVTMGVLWEIYEFSFDGLLGLNMQKFALENGTNLVGRLALMDTMKDLIVDALGAFVVSIMGYISLKYKKGWLDKLLITKVKEDN